MLTEELQNTSEFVVDMPVFIKASLTKDGTRMITFESSNEFCDGEGDVILQNALLKSSDSFLRGTIDIDHLSEIGGRYGIANPEQYIVGRPTRVFDMGGGRTGVEGELFKNAQSDKVWEGLQATPAQPWRASIYGFPVNGGMTDVRTEKCSNSFGASRYLVSQIIWKSVALTLNPVNDSIIGHARIMKSEAFIKSYVEIMKGYQDGTGLISPPPPVPSFQMFPPRDRAELMMHFHAHISQGKCIHGGVTKSHSTYQFKEHFENCVGMDPFNADVHANALMNLLRRH